MSLREFQLLDENSILIYEFSGTTINLPAKKSITPGTDSFEYEYEIVERTYGNGAVKLGLPRMVSRDLTISFNRVHEKDSDFRLAENTLLTALDSAYYLYDKNNDLRVKIAVLGYRIPYDDGGYQLSADNELRLRMLDPFWEKSTEESYSMTLSGGSLNTISVQNDGALPVPPILTFTTTVAVNDIEIYVDVINEGIQIQDSIFGTGKGKYEMIVDNKLGTVSVGNFDRIGSLVAGTGFFNIPVGAQDIIIIPNVGLEVVLKYNERFFI